MMAQILPMGRSHHCLTILLRYFGPLSVSPVPSIVRDRALLPSVPSAYMKIHYSTKCATTKNYLIFSLVPEPFLIP